MPFDDVTVRCCRGLLRQCAHHVTLIQYLSPCIFLGQSLHVTRMWLEPRHNRALFRNRSPGGSRRLTKDASLILLDLVLNNYVVFVNFESLFVSTWFSGNYLENLMSKTDGCILLASYNVVLVMFLKILQHCRAGHKGIRSTKRIYLPLRIGRIFTTINMDVRYIFLFNTIP